MTGHTQLTTDGAQEPLQALVPHRSPEYVAVPLFTAPQTMRGQLHLPTDTPSELHAGGAMRESSGHEDDRVQRSAARRRRAAIRSRADARHARR